MNGEHWSFHRRRRRFVVDVVVIKSSLKLLMEVHHLSSPILY